MKKVFRKMLIASIVISTSIPSGLLSQPYFDKDGSLNTQRRLYLSSKYHMTLDQISRYESALANKTTQSNLLFDQIVSKNDRILKHKNICNDFKVAVQGIMTTDQFQMWIEDNRNSDQTRRYRENLSLTDSELQLFYDIIQLYHKSYKDVAKMNTTEDEKRKQQLIARDNRNKSLHNLLTNRNVGELIKYLDLEDKASYVRGHWPMFSYNFSYVLGELYLNADYAMVDIQNTGLDEKSFLREKQSIYKKLNDNIKNKLTSQQYAEWSRYNSKYLNENLMKRYDMTPSQFAAYKDIMNTRAIDRFIIYKSVTKGVERTSRLDSVDLVAYNKLQKEISVKSADIWLRNMRPYNK